MRRGHPPKYEPLRRYLAALPAEAATVTMRFAEIEALIEAPLPPTARLRSWWAQAARGQPQVRAWSAAGWRVALVMQVRPWRVTFVRTDTTAGPAARNRRPAPPAGRGRRRRALGGLPGGAGGRGVRR